MGWCMTSACFCRPVVSTRVNSDVVVVVVVVEVEVVDRWRSVVAVTMGFGSTASSTCPCTSVSTSTNNMQSSRHGVVIIMVMNEGMNECSKQPSMEMEMEPPPICENTISNRWLLIVIEKYWYDRCEQSARRPFCWRHHILQYRYDVLLQDRIHMTVGRRNLPPTSNI